MRSQSAHQEHLQAVESFSVATQKVFLRLSRSQNLQIRPMGYLKKILYSLNNHHKQTIFVLRYLDVTHHHVQRNFKRRVGADISSSFYICARSTQMFPGGL